MKAVQINHRGAVVGFCMVFNKLGTAFEVFQNPGLTKQRHPFRLPIVKGRGQKMATASGLNDVARHYAAVLDVVTGLIASRVNLED